MSRVSRTSIAALSVALLTMSAAACGSDDDQAAFNVEQELSSRTLDALQNAQIDLEDDEIDCSAEVTDETVATGTCTGTDTDGNAIVSTLNGTVDPETATCDSTIVITQGDEVIKQSDGVDCLNRMQGIEVEP
jgi:hypothetical protein